MQFVVQLDHAAHRLDRKTLDTLQADANEEQKDGDRACCASAWCSPPAVSACAQLPPSWTYWTQRFPLTSLPLLEGPFRSSKRSAGCFRGALYAAALLMQLAFPWLDGALLTVL